MKQYSILITCILLLQSHILPAQGVIWHSGDWNAALAQAKAQNKLIFLDAYTSWCGPCKKMVKEVFPMQEVGAYYNENFINVSMDMEKGEGPALDKQYRVGVYPTLLFIDGEGVIQHRVAGYHNPTQFVQLGKAANNVNARLGGMAKRFEGGERDPVFLRNYTSARYDAMDESHEPIAVAYLTTQTNVNTNKNREFIYTYVEKLDSKLFEYLIQYRSDFENQYGKEDIAQRIQQIIEHSIARPGMTLDMAQTEALFQKIYPNETKERMTAFLLSYYRNNGMYDKYAETAETYFKSNKKVTANELNEVAWNFYENITDEKLLKKALDWAQKAVKMEDNYYNNDTLAALLFKLGKKEKAKKAALHAVELAKKGGEDDSATQELLKKIDL